ncbi:DUF1572 domain-containing protein [candidate division GN15 bacterium]|nr:DUF1572 domain-containing protein [candidate division GN15 bacterium]
MHQSVAPLAQLYKFNDAVLDMALQDIRPADQFVRPMEKANSINFIVGHITSTRFVTASLLGQKSEAPWGDIYGRGKRIDPDVAYPDLVELLAAWRQQSVVIGELLEQATEEQLAAEAPFQPPGNPKTILGAVAFLLAHEAIHLGQLSYARRLLGYDRAFDK